VRLLGFYVVLLLGFIVVTVLVFRVERYLGFHAVFRKSLNFRRKPQAIGELTCLGIFGPAEA
jgi:hypothetical protein